MSLIFNSARARKQPSLVNAQAYVRLTANGVQLPARAGLSPFAFLIKKVAGSWKKYNLPAEVYCAPNKDFCFVTGFGCGGPAAAMTAEQLIALGVKELIFVGTAGSLQEEVRPGDIVVCDESICADGTSPHYTSRELVRADKSLTARLAASLRAEKLDFHLGRNWSTDTPYRETNAEVKHYQKNHVLTVDMETSALFAVCARRKVAGAAVFVVSDYIGGGVWQPDFRNPLIWQNLRRLVATTLK